MTTAWQELDVLSVIQEAALKNEALLDVVEDTQYFPSGCSVTLGIPGEHQKSNAAMAIRISELFTQQVEKKPLLKDIPFDEQVKYSLEKTFWPGRSHIFALPHPNPSVSIQMYTDGAHTLKSIRACVQWYLSSRAASSLSILLFNTSHNREYGDFLREIAQLTPFDHCIFTNFETGQWTCPERQSPELQQSMQREWLKSFPDASTFVCK